LNKNDLKRKKVWIYFTNIPKVNGKMGTGDLN
jgi:hypothetical protein